MSMGRIHHPSGSWKVLVVGNNPLELGLVFDRLLAIPHKMIHAEMAFDLKSFLNRIGGFQPQHILIDDNVGKVELQTMVNAFQRRRTGHAPITILKNSNYDEAIGAGVMNFVLKQNLTSDRLYREMLNSNHFFETQRLWGKVYGKRKGQIVRLLEAAVAQI
jgi:hypothetical protein